ncbi:MAG: glycosyltransferase family 2 protein [Coriobacteriales bacterium]|jgi:rhamnosyltransferase
MKTAAISVIVPTLNAESEIAELLELLSEQSMRPTEVLVVDSESNDRTLDIARQFDFVTTYCIRRKEFNHGLTRHQAFLRTTGEFVCFLTQDALPTSDDYLKNLIEPMQEDETIALVCGRQVPKADARRYEQLVRQFNYPDSGNVRSIDDLDRMGIKTFFASDVCSAYRRDPYLKCGGFQEVDTNEDMLMAASLLYAGYKVAYEPSAAVIHSHNLSFREQYRRNVAVGFFIEEHRGDLGGAKESGEGARLVKVVSGELLSEGKFAEVIRFGIDCLARALGNRAGRRAALEVKKNRPTT